MTPCPVPTTMMGGPPGHGKERHLTAQMAPVMRFGDGPMAAAFTLIAPRLAEVERFIAAQLADAPSSVREAGSYVFEGGGKRLRPAMVLLVSRLLGYEGERDVRYGAVIEMIHTATLVHDDIIDHAPLRRGRPTANNKWGNQLTVLLGDWLYTRSMELALEVDDIAVMRVLSRATIAMIEGEMIGLKMSGRLDTDETTYMDIVRRKTAGIFSAATSIPALFDPAFARFRRALAEYGEHLGVCFQIADDLLDLTGSESSLGKPVFSDLREGKLTLPFIRLLPRLSDRERACLAHVLATGELPGDTEKELRDLLARHRIVEEVRAVALQFAERATARVASFPPGAERDALAAAPRFVIEREF